MCMLKQYCSNDANVESFCLYFVHCLNENFIQFKPRLGLKTTLVIMYHWQKQTPNLSGGENCEKETNIAICNIELCTKETNIAICRHQ